VTFVDMFFVKEDVFENEQFFAKYLKLIRICLLEENKEIESEFLFFYSVCSLVLTFEYEERSINI
jgi:hypothetical protein